MRAVAVGPEDRLAGQDQRLLADHLMADAAPDFKQMCDTLFPHPLADFGVILGVLGGGSRGRVIQRDGDAIRSDQSRCAGRLEDAPDRRRVIMAENQIGPDIKHIARTCIRDSSRPRQRFFGKRSACHSAAPINI
jgi:hypothetical protein